MTEVSGKGRTVPSGWSHAAQTTSLALPPNAGKWYVGRRLGGVPLLNLMSGVMKSMMEWMDVGSSSTHHVCS